MVGNDDVTYQCKSFVDCFVCFNTSTANREEQYTQTDFDAPPTVQAIDSIYTINEENDVTISNENYVKTSRDKYDVTDIVHGKGTRCLSAPVLSMRRSFSFPVLATSISTSVHRSNILECQTVEGVSLAVEKVVVFSFESLVAGDVASISESATSLPHLLDEGKVDCDEKASENIYQRVSLLRSTEL
jgi:hypothetical protein